MKLYDMRVSSKTVVAEPESDIINEKKKNISWIS